MELSKDIPQSNPSSTPAQRDWRFALVFIANLTVDLLSALDLTAVSTALPTIVNRLNGSDFIWVGSAYAISSTAILPMVGGLASTFGRKRILLVFIVLFGIGSAICGASQSLEMLIAGRVIQGMGGGGCISVTEIIYADLVPLPERGKFQGITASVWAFACAIGPPIGGTLANSDQWRWLFFLNLPVGAIAFLLVVLFLQVQTPKADMGQVFKKTDWGGLILIIGGTISTLIGLTWGGVKFPWSSSPVLVPICLGAAALVFFFIYEYKFAPSQNQTIPPFILSNRTTLTGYIGTLAHGIVSMAVIFYLPVYFQAALGASPLRAGVEFMALALPVPPLSILTGLSTLVFKKYRPQNYLGWIVILIGFGLLTRLDTQSSKAEWVGYQIILAIGLGIVWISTQFPILAPLPFSNNAHALAFFTFVRCFAQTWGTVIGGAILQNRLKSQLPPEYLSTFASDAQLIYAVIPNISSLEPALQAEVRNVFAQGLRVIWYTMLGLSAVGLFSCIFMKEIELKTALDDSWGLRNEEGTGDTVVVDAENKSG